MQPTPYARLLPWAILVILFLGDVTILFIAYRSEHRPLTVTFLDVGQGDSVLIEAPNGNTLLYDAGPGNAVLPRLGRALGFFGRTIDVTVASHPDADHIGGFPEVIRRYHVEVMLVSGASSTNKVDDEADNAIIETGVHRFVAHQGERIDLGGGVVADVLYPDRPTANMETNDASIVLKVTYGQTSFLLSGDLPRNFEQVVAGEYGSGLSATVLKLGHHGSRTSSDPMFLEAVHPSFAVVSAGYKNKYGHPHKETMEAMRELGIPVYRTDLMGDVTFTSDGEKMTVKTGKQAKQSPSE